jgi:DNA-binding NtrC family response regulator
MKALRPGISVILMTAYTAADIIAEAEREGAVRVLAKPVVLSGLLEMLEQTGKDVKPVLIVADDAELLAGLCTMLTERGYLTLRSENLSDALIAIEEKAPAAVVLDLHLDGVSSEDCVVAIRRVSPGIALILCNGYAVDVTRPPEAVQGRLIRASLRKPFPPARLIEILDEVFAG